MPDETKSEETVGEIKAYEIAAARYEMQEYILAVAIKTRRTTARLRSLKHLEIHTYVLCASLEYGDVALVTTWFVRKTPRLRDLF